MPLYGYARVSTRDQDLALQLNELTAAGCAKVFKEKASGAKTDRPELAKAISRLEPGDVLVVTRLDRLARSTRDTGRHLGTHKVRPTVRGPARRVSANSQQVARLRLRAMHRAARR